MVATYLVTGASRGIGFELTKQLLARGDHVIAAVRDPSKASALQSLPNAAHLDIVKIDVEHPESIKEAAAALEAKYPDGVDVLINNAGVLGSFARTTEAPIDDSEFVHKVNVIGPLRVSQAMLPLLKKGHRKLIANVSSTLGSIGDKAQYIKNYEARKANPFASKIVAYKMAKAALNMQTMSLAADLKDDGITVICYCPGWVQTDMGNSGATEFDGKAGPELTPEDSIKAQLKLIDRADLSITGGYFLAPTGEPLPW